MSLTILPVEIIFKILEKVPVKWILEFKKTCKHLHGVVNDVWSHLIIQRYGIEYIPEDGNCQATYIRLDKESRLLNARQMQIAWSHEPRYWEYEGDAARLKSVCWFDVNAEFMGVERGVYIPRVKLSFHDPFNLQDILVEARSNHCVSKVLGRFPIHCKDQGCVYFVLDALTVDASIFNKVHVSLKDSSNAWKSGLDIHSIELVKSTDIENMSEYEPTQTLSHEENLTEEEDNEEIRFPYRIPIIGPWLLRRQEQ